MSEAPVPLTGGERTIRRVEAVLLGCSAMLIAATMLIGAADIVQGMGLNAYIPGKVELSEIMIATATFLALPCVSWRDSHVRVDIISQYFRGWVKRLAAVIEGLATLAISGLFAYAAWRGFNASWAKREVAQGLLPIPIYPMKLAAFLAFAACAVIAVVFLLRLIRPTRRAGHTQP